MRYFQQLAMNRMVRDLASEDVVPEKYRPREDHYLHAPGQICQKCGRAIEAGQTARRRGETGWVHDLCPAREDNAGDHEGTTEAR